MFEKQKLGQQGEGTAEELLLKNGYRILAKNFKTKLGEIDIIARDKDTVCFVEVKTRTSTDFGGPLEAVSFFKQRKLSQVALMFLKSRKLLDSKARFDVIAVTVDEDKRNDAVLVQNAFELALPYRY